MTKTTTCRKGHVHEGTNCGQCRAEFAHRKAHAVAAHFFARVA